MFELESLINILFMVSCGLMSVVAERGFMIVNTRKALLKSLFVSFLLDIVLVLKRIWSSLGQNQS